MTDQDFINEIQRLINDKPLSKLVKGDNVSAMIQSGRDTFPLSSRNIVDPGDEPTAVFQVQIDGAPFVDATLTDKVTGVGTTPTVPLKSCAFLYYFQFFTSAEILDFRNNGLRQVGIDPTNASAVSEITQALFMASCYLAAAEALRVKVQDYVKFYDVSASGKDFRKSAVYTNQMKTAETYEGKAETVRKEIYTRQDRALQPAFTTNRGSYQGNNNQPRR